MNFTLPHFRFWRAVGERRHRAKNKVERVVLNALGEIAALPPDIQAFGDLSRVVFGEADPPVTLSRTSVFGER